jgi:hypothetical protein
VTAIYVASDVSAVDAVARLNVLLYVPAIDGVASRDITADRTRAIEGMAAFDRTCDIAVYGKSVVAVNVYGIAVIGYFAFGIVPESVAYKPSAPEHGYSYGIVVLPVYTFFDFLVGDYNFYPVFGFFKRNGATFVIFKYLFDYFFRFHFNSSLLYYTPGKIRNQYIYGCESPFFPELSVAGAFLTVCGEPAVQKQNSGTVFISS